MAIELQKILVSGGFGVVDLALEENPITLAGQDAKDIVRVGATLGGYLLNMMGFYPDIGETLFISSLPLTVKTIWSFVKGSVGTKKVPVRHTLTVTPPGAARRKQIEVVGLR